MLGGGRTPPEQPQRKIGYFYTTPAPWKPPGRNPYHRDWHWEWRVHPAALKSDEVFTDEPRLSLANDTPRNLLAAWSTPTLQVRVRSVTALPTEPTHGPLGACTSEWSRWSIPKAVSTVPSTPGEANP